MKKFVNIFTVILTLSSWLLLSSCKSIFDQKVSNSIISNSTNWLITDLKWGSLKVGPFLFKDVRIWPNNAEEWDWSKTGTRHRPGIQVADLADFIDLVDVIILSQGVDGVLQIKPETIDFIKKSGKELIIERTPLAVQKYNELISTGKRIGALIHTTC